MDKLVNLINKGVSYVQRIAPALAILALTFQGLKFFKGSGQDKAEAKDAIFWILVGLAIVFLASSIITTLQSDMGW